MDQKVIDNLFKKFGRLIPKWIEFIDESFLPPSLNGEYKKLIARKANQIELEN